MQTVQVTNPAGTTASAVIKSGSMACASGLFKKQVEAPASGVVYQDSERGYAVVRTDGGQLRVMAIRPTGLYAYLESESWHANTTGMGRSEKYRYQLEVAGQRDDFEETYAVCDDCPMGERVRYTIDRSSVAELLNDLYEMHGQLTVRQLLFGVSGPNGSTVTFDLAHLEEAADELSDALLDQGIISDSEIIAEPLSDLPLGDYRLSGNALFLNGGIA